MASSSTSSVQKSFKYDVFLSFRGEDTRMETRIDNFLSSLEYASNDFCMIGIWGMLDQRIGGGGKTTLARAVFNKISFQFEGKSFIENVREVSNDSLSDLKLLQKRVLSDVLNDQYIKVGSENEGKNMMSWMMCGRKVILVLDDVDHVDQLEALAGKHSWFKPASIIIITTREQQVLLAHEVKIHNLNLLSDKEAICLFGRYAFGKEIPIQGYEELSGQVVCYAAGLPLTIKVLGSFLCGKSKPEWVDTLARLKTIPLEETQKKLELSYFGLDDDHKEIFLDIATILKGQWKNQESKHLKAVDFMLELV
ncbi:TMV resistance protein N [Lactuca sativa]|uniref:TMV resistance protein N n=1 Tax=Lactuca sativa TaxID=4236 RepID=UPI001C68DF7D|nr:TMV resistance protein N [Lactuca sativa]